MHCCTGLRANRYTAPGSPGPERNPDAKSAAGRIAVTGRKHDQSNVTDGKTEKYACTS
jgi:hypothetical protein